MTYKVGLVGARRGSSLVQPFTLFPETQVVALCDVDEQRVAGVAEELGVDDRSVYTRYEAFLEAPIDIVVVGTPIQLIRLRIASASSTRPGAADAPT